MNAALLSQCRVHRVDTRYMMHTLHAGIGATCDTPAIVLCSRSTGLGRPAERRVSAPAALFPVMREASRGRMAVDAPTSGGTPLRLAIMNLTAGPFAAPGMIFEGMPPQPSMLDQYLLCLRDDPNRTRLWKTLWSDIALRIKDGELVAFGCEENEPRRMIAATEFWNLKLGKNDETLSSASTTYLDVVIYPVAVKTRLDSPAETEISTNTAKVQSRPINIKAKAHTVEDEKACETWLIEEWPNRPGWSKPNWRCDAKQIWNLLSKPGFDVAWSRAGEVHPGMSAKGRKPRIR